MPHHDHSHPDGEVCEHTPIDIDADLEHGHRLHNHMHHNLHQHVTNEISTASSLSAANQSFHTNNNKCVPCAYSNDMRPTASLMGGHGSKEDLDNNDDHAPVSIVVSNSPGKKELKSTNTVIEQIKSKSLKTNIQVFYFTRHSIAVRMTEIYVPIYFRKICIDTWHRARFVYVSFVFFKLIACALNLILLTDKCQMFFFLHDKTI
jgi:hypothetical protein